MNERNLSDAELLNAVGEGLRIYQEGRREWEAKGFWAKVGVLWCDMPWLGRIAVFMAVPLMVLCSLASIAMGMMS